MSEAALCDSFGAGYEFGYVTGYVAASGAESGVSSGESTVTIQDEVVGSAYCV